MDFKQIEAFISVARLKSFSKAANSIFLSQPTISSHILSLEKELDIQLFDRNSKEVNLTPAGKCFYDFAIDMINTRNNAISSLGDFNKTISGTLNLAASTTPCNTIVPTLISEFSSRYPDITFNIMEQSSGEIINNIINLNCELGIVGNMVENEKIKSYSLLEDSLVLISSPVLNLPDKIDIDALTDYKFILREKNSATRKTFESELTSLGFPTSRLKVCSEVNNLDTLLQFVKAGLGISVVSKAVASEYAASGKLRYTSVENLTLTRHIYLVINSKRTLTPTATAFLNLCREHFCLND